jgi:hypothetical protein
MKALEKSAYMTGAVAGGLVGALSGVKKREGESNKTRLKRTAARGLIGASLGGGLEAAAVGTKRHMEARKYKTRAQNLSKQNKSMIESQRVQLDNLQGRLDAMKLDKNAYSAKHYAGASLVGGAVGALSGAKRREGESNKDRLKRMAARGAVGAGLGAGAMAGAHAHRLGGSLSKEKQMSAAKDVSHAKEKGRLNNKLEHAHKRFKAVQNTALGVDRARNNLQKEHNVLRAKHTALKDEHERAGVYIRKLHTEKLNRKK